MIERLWRAALSLLTALALVGALGACGGDDSCEDACGKIYSECKLEITGLSQSDCVSECKASASSTEDIKCVMSASCEASSLEACL